MNLNFSLKILTLGALLTLISPSLQADPGATANVFFIHGEAGGPGGNSKGPYSTSINVSDPTVPYNGTGMASVTKTGLLIPSFHVFASAPGTSTGVTEGVGSSATFTDTLMFRQFPAFQGPAGTPPVKTFDVVFDISGSLQGAASGTFSGQYGAASGGVGLTGGKQQFVLTVTTADLETYLDVDGLPQVGGAISFTLGVGVNSGGGAINVADFEDTVQLAEIEAFDANGDPVAGEFFDTVDSDNTVPGLIDFMANTDFVPEPGTVPLLLSGLGLVMVWGGFRRGRMTA